MKKISLLCVSFCLIISISKAQINPNINQIAETDLLFQKAKKQKTTARILCVSGGVIAAIGSILVISQLSNVLQNIFISDYKSKNASGALFMFYTGGAMMLGSIPFFIASGKNKRKAALSF